MIYVPLSSKSNDVYRLHILLSERSDHRPPYRVVGVPTCQSGGIAHGFQERNERVFS